MNEKILKLYYDGFLVYLSRMIDFKEYDSEIYSQNMYFNPSNSRKNNLGSEYYSLLNNFYIDKLTDEQKQLILSKSQVDEELIQIVEKTYFDILKKGKDMYVIYNPPMPGHIVRNGCLVLEFTYGKTNIELSDLEYLELSKSQRQYISTLNEKLKQEINNKLKLPCEIFVEKRI